MFWCLALCWTRAIVQLVWGASRPIKRGWMNTPLPLASCSYIAELMPAMYTGCHVAFSNAMLKRVFIRQLKHALWYQFGEAHIHLQSWQMMPRRHGSSLVMLGDQCEDQCVWRYTGWVSFPACSERGGHAPVVQRSAWIAHLGLR